MLYYCTNKSSSEPRNRVEVYGVISGGPSPTRALGGGVQVGRTVWTKFSIMLNTAVTSLHLIPEKISLDFEWHQFTFSNRSEQVTKDTILLVVIYNNVKCNDVNSSSVLPLITVISGNYLCTSHVICTLQGMQVATQELATVYHWDVNNHGCLQRGAREGACPPNPELCISLNVHT